MTERTPKYGRLLEDFEVGAVYAHPWEVTVDAGTVALFQASFLDATPTYASARYAWDLGLRDRPMPPLLLLNLGLSFSVHDVSEQAIAHLAYIDVRFPEAAYAGDTLVATSRVMGVKPSSSGDKGVVHVRTSLTKLGGSTVCVFERKALVRAGRSVARSEPVPVERRVSQPPEPSRLPPELRETVRVPPRAGGFAGFASDFAAGDVIFHDTGKTVGESEHMQLTALCRNTHPLHFDEVYCRGGHASGTDPQRVPETVGASFAKTRVVYGGLVFAWVAALASRDTTGNVLWDMGFDQGAHPAGVLAGDTLFAASKVLGVQPHDPSTSRVTFRLIGTKNRKPADLARAGADLFTAELGKSEGKVPEKVFEIDRTVLMRSRA
jgi:2-methylfumaryl-CoA hydratase